MHYLKSSCFVIGVLLIAVACKKDQVAVVTSPWCDYYASPNPKPECVPQDEVALEELADYVIGVWELRASACGHCISPGCNAIPEGQIRVTFFENGNFRSQYGDGSLMTGRYVVQAEPVWGNRVIIEDDDPNGGFFYTPVFLRLCGPNITYIDSRPADGVLYVYERVE